MKIKSLLALGLTCLLIVSCKGYEKVPYFQDLQQQSEIQLSKIKADLSQIQTSDKLSIVVSSAATPEVAARYNLPLNAASVGRSVMGNRESVMPYIVDSKGNIELPEIGKIRVAGLTREAVGTLVADLIKKKSIIRDAVVTVEVLNHYVYVLGEVTRPGRISIERDNITLLEAIAQSGDLTITGLRENVAVIRTVNGEKKTYFVDLTNAESVFNSPAYQLQPNDYVYVTPNLTRQRMSTPWSNTWQNPSIYLTMTSVLLSAVVLVSNLVRK